MTAHTAEHAQPVLLTTTEAARVLGVSDDTVRRAAKDGTLHPLRLRARGWLRFRADEIEQLLDGGR